MIQVSTIEFIDSSKVELPPILYKYRDWAKPLHKRIISHREVYFASPEEFKDKNDCKIPIRYDLLSFKDVYEGIKFYNPSLSRQLCRARTKEWIKRGQENAMQKQSEIMTEMLKSYGILSLTAIPDNEEMWEAYSNKHTGFCVGFDTEIMFKYLGGGGIVNYMDELPIIYPFPKTSLEERHVLQIFSKLKQWDHEREYRTFEFSPSPLNESQRKKILPPEVFKEIIVGNKMPLDLKDELVRLIPKELAHIKILKEKEI